MRGTSPRMTTLVFLLVIAAALIGAAAQPRFPTLTGRVVDEANVIDAGTKARLDEKLAALEQKSGTQLVVATLPSLQGYDIADYGYQLGRAWGIGQKGKNNGALLIVAPHDRKVRIEVGYGLEGVLTDAVTRLIIENAILPRFRASDFSGGIVRGVDDILQVLSGDAGEFKRRAERASRPSGQEGMGSFILVLLILFIFLIIFMRSSGRSQGYRTGWGRGPVILPPMGGGWGGGWGQGGGSGSGGGGFSGGGGSFGGGGSSGSW
jgi:uncharacterized protein